LWPFFRIEDTIGTLRPKKRPKIGFGGCGTVLNFGYSTIIVLFTAGTFMAMLMHKCSCNAAMVVHKCGCIGA